MIELWIEGVGIFAPGLVGWEQAAPVLAGQRPYVPGETPKLVPALLPADMRRRTTDHIRLAVEVASESVRQAQADAATLWTVFATSEGEGTINHYICEEVGKAQPEISPTRFHNSVINAPAGYWCMAVQSQAPSTSLSGFDASVGAGLIEAGVQVRTERCHVLLVLHDTPFPEPLHSVRPISHMFGAALVLAPVSSARSLARLTIGIEPVLHAPSRLPDADLDGMRTGNPSARILPVLAAVARRETTDLYLPYVHSQSLRVSVQPMNESRSAQH